jgi:hypothetical protein
MTRAKFEDSRHFKAWKVTKKHQGTKREEVQAKSRRPQKLDCSIFYTGVPGFPRTDRV